MKNESWKRKDDVSTFTSKRRDVYTYTKKAHAFPYTLYTLMLGTFG